VGTLAPSGGEGWGEGRNSIVSVIEQMF